MPETSLDIHSLTIEESLQPSEASDPPTESGSVEELDSLESAASKLARSHTQVSDRPRPGSIAPRLQAVADVLQEAHSRLQSSAELAHDMPSASEWLQDNFFLVQRAIRQIQEAMPVGYLRRLPRLQASSGAPVTRVEAIALALVEHCHAAVAIDHITRFVETYQETSSLTLGELWALPTMLRFGALCLLARVLGNLLGIPIPENLSTDPVLNRLTESVNPESLVGSAISSLRTLDTQPWTVFLESVSQVELTLRQDPLNAYSTMDADTRDRYRRAVETIARHSGKPEYEVAERIVQLAEAALTSSGSSSDGIVQAPRQAHVGYYLMDAGRLIVEAELGCRIPRDEHIRRWMKRHAAWAYPAVIAGTSLSAAFVAAYCVHCAGGSWLQIGATALLACIPASIAIVAWINWLVMRIVPPVALPKMDFSRAVAPEYRTMVAIPVIFGSVDDVDATLRRLEQHYISNQDPQIRFALLTDVADAPVQDMPEDADIIDRAATGIKALNEKYAEADGSSPFILCHRTRAWNENEGAWMGWERKRGKLEELARLLRGEETSYTLMVGDVGLATPTRYVITLDADTRLPGGTARRLIGALAHPLNQAVLDPRTGEVDAGYTVLQPRMGITPSSASASTFARIYATDSAIDLYSRAVSDVYQDMVGEGIYAGKGIYDVEAFDRCLNGRVPENALLSHDLFEGLHGRAALVTDIVLYESYPPDYLSYSHRLHRWVRGDWQLLPWLFSRVPGKDGRRIANKLSLIDRWKVLDNLRRSLQTPALLALLVAGWLWLPGHPGIWTFGALLASGAHLVTALLDLAAATIHRRAHPLHESVYHSLLRWLLSLVFLPYEAILMLDAVLTTLVRVYVTHQHLLQWTTAAHTVRLLGKQRQLALMWGRMGAAPAIAILLSIAVGVLAPDALPSAIPFVLAWLISPWIAGVISRPARPRRRSVSQPQRRQLRRVARRMWRYFEEYVGPNDNWLPPDHYQEHPNGLLAHRTSPTNVGLALLSTLAAYDLGYTGPLALVLRLRSTMDAMERMERYRGHFFNWYETQQLSPLPPRYVSTVDSGNLAGCLIALKHGLTEMLNRPTLDWPVWQGFQDALSVLEETVAELRPSDESEPGHRVTKRIAQLRERIDAQREMPGQWYRLLDELIGREWDGLEELLGALVDIDSSAIPSSTLHELGAWTTLAIEHLYDMKDTFDTLMPWTELMANSPAILRQPTLHPVVGDAWESLQHTLDAIPTIGAISAVCSKALEQVGEVVKSITSCQEELMAFPSSGETGEVTAEVREALGWCTELSEALRNARLTAETYVIGIDLLVVQAEAYLRKMDFSFLFDDQRKVFHIGLDVDAGQLDPNYYDLLASEARIASIVAIAKGDVPQEHWLHLGRPMTSVEGKPTLLSWSGTMFEYLMPTLLMKTYPGSLLERSVQSVIGYQISYAQRRKVPWGISESGYYHFDAARNYQYRAFGAPGVGFKRGLDEDLVIAPYASLLALPFRPEDVMDNIERFEQIGMLGPYGLYEAIDYTPSRVARSEHGAIVRSYMVHHHGMSLLAIANTLLNRSMVGRFHADPRIQTIELLLQEQVPAQVPLEYPSRMPSLAADVLPQIETGPWETSLSTTFPQVHALSNGAYSVIVTAAGGGYSAWEGLSLTRWRPDTTLDEWGTWLYVKDLEDNTLWSATAQPIRLQGVERSTIFHPHAAELRSRFRDIAVRIDVTVATGSDTEIRRITIANQSDRTRRISLVSYAELALAPMSLDERHPAFNKLFIESESVPEAGALVYRRRPRSSDDDPVFLAYSLVLEDAEAPSLGLFETDRARFIGRGSDASCPVALMGDGIVLTSATGATLDPVVVSHCELELAPYGEARIATVMTAARDRTTALTPVRRFQSWTQVTQAFEEAEGQSKIELHRLQLPTPQLQTVEQLLSALLYPTAALRATPETLTKNTLWQSGLWTHGISGDYPILLVRVRTRDHLDLLREALTAHCYWRARSVEIDLVILNEREEGYAQEFRGEIRRVLQQTKTEARLGQHGGIFIVTAAQLRPDERALLETTARAILDGERKTLADHLRGVLQPPATLPALAPTRPPSPSREAGTSYALQRPADLIFDNGLGGFSPDGTEYMIYLEPGAHTPAPWINVIANPEFGFLVSESGGGYTWAFNSGENRLTTWRNDPVSDMPSEAIYIRDEETVEIWSPTPLPAPADAPYLIRHSAGSTSFVHHSHELQQNVHLCVAPDAPVKIARLTLTNQSDRVRRITVTYYAEWVLGPSRSGTQQYIVSEFDAATNALLARNAYNADFGQQVAFVASDHSPHGVTTDRAEFLGLRGTLRHPVALDRVGLGGAVEAGLDPCAVYQVHLDLAPGESHEVVFVVGQAEGRSEAVHLARTYANLVRARQTAQQVADFWNENLGRVQVSTPDRATDLLLNRWLLYQTIACRLWGRSALYQSSGAYGYRDQLQDVLALLHTRPDLTREHILRAAEHQFEEGDVLHWWHPPASRGVRTRMTDDLLWLPYVVTHYIEVTGDAEILGESISFLKADPLGPDEAERYAQYSALGEPASLFDHCLRALERGTTSSQRGLPLIGHGDWNDGMNRVGIGGQGESVWLGWFLYSNLSRFADLCDQLGENMRATRLRQQAEDLRHALNANAWDGQWYIRATYDDGCPLGSAASDECQIDAIAQSWAVLSGAADPKRAEEAMASVYERLVREDDRLVLLFTPPFDRTQRDPGYIKGYPPGIRENGGQYTHAAMWTVWSFAALGQGNLAGRLFSLLNPIQHSDTVAKRNRYRVEPYVVSADVYGAPPHTGRGGWTWYTGSSGWMYRLGLEAILGIRRRADTLTISPCIPSDWTEYSVAYQYGGSTYHIQVRNPEAVCRGIRSVQVDGASAPPDAVHLRDDGCDHHIQMVMG